MRAHEERAAARAPCSARAHACGSMLAHPTHACLGRVQVNEGSAEKPKWGWVGTKPGAELHFMLNTTLPPGISPELVGGHVGAPARVIVRGRGGGGRRCTADP